MEGKSAQAIQGAHVMEAMEGQVEEDQMNVEEIEKDMETVEKGIHMVAAADGNAKLKDR